MIWAQLAAGWDKRKTRRASPTWFASKTLGKVQLAVVKHGVFNTLTNSNKTIGAREKQKRNAARTPASKFDKTIFCYFNALGNDSIGGGFSCFLCGSLFLVEGGNKRETSRVSPRVCGRTVALRKRIHTERVNRWLFPFSPYCCGCWTQPLRDYSQTANGTYFSKATSLSIRFHLPSLCF